MTAKIKLVCATCGCEFMRYRSLVNPEQNSYCSIQCRKTKPTVTYVIGANECIKHAKTIGYVALPSGLVINPNGEPVNLYANQGTGYIYFSAFNCKSPISLHRFIAYQIHGDAALLAECVRHLNDVRTDNRFDNITYGTREQNYADIPIEKRSLMGRKRNRKRRRYSDDQVREIRALIKEGMSLKRIRRLVGGGFGSITHIRDGITYRDVV